MKKKKKHNNNNKSQWNVKKIKRKVKKMWRRKSWLGITALICVLIALVSMSTFAWFSTTDAKENRFKSKFSYQVELVEEFTPKDHIEFDKGYKKEVKVVNTGDIPAFARVLVFPEIRKANQSLPIDDTVSISYNIEKKSPWILGEDGYYYYTKMLKPKEESDVLFNEITFDIKDKKEFEEKYVDALVTIDVNLESIDARKNEYRFSWWGNYDLPLMGDKLKEIDSLLQKEMR